MANVNVNELTKEQMQKAMACETPEDLMKLAKENGYELTKDEAEAYMAEGEVVELSDADMERVAGGVCWSHTEPPDTDNCPRTHDCPQKCGIHR